MTSRATYLRLSPVTNRWTPTTRPFNLARHGRPPRPPPPSSSRVTDAKAKEPFKTLAADVTPVPGVQAPRSTGGAREGVPKAGMAVASDSPAVSVDAGKGGTTVGQGARKGMEWMGVDIPLKPAAPKEGECCMSGCAVCVYDLYLEDLEHFHSSLASARKSVMARLDGLPAQERERRILEWPDELGDKPGEGVVGKEGGVDAKAEAEKELERERKTLDPTVRAFLEMEARLKAKSKGR